MRRQHFSLVLRFPAFSLLLQFINPRLCLLLLLLDFHNKYQMEVRVDFKQTNPKFLQPELLTTSAVAPKYFLYLGPRHPDFEIGTEFEEFAHVHQV